MSGRGRVPRGPRSPRFQTNSNLEITILDVCRLDIISYICIRQFFTSVSYYIMFITTLLSLFNWLVHGALVRLDFMCGLYHDFNILHFTNPLNINDFPIPISRVGLRFNIVARGPRSPGFKERSGGVCAKTLLFCVILCPAMLQPALQPLIWCFKS